jgi:hypothetical protein
MLQGIDFHQVLHNQEALSVCILFIGYDKLGEEVFRELFKRLLRQCVQKGLVKAGHRGACSGYADQLFRHATGEHLWH